MAPRRNRRGLARKKKPYRQFMKSYAPSRWRAPVSSMPDSMMFRLKYNDAFTLLTGALITPKIYRGNSLFDTDFAIGGHQPYSYDQLTALYGRYFVSSCEIVVRVSTNSSPGVRVVCVPMRTPEQTLGMSTYCEVPRAKTVLISNNDGIATIRSKVSTRAMAGEGRSDKLEAQYDANPAEMWYWILTHQTDDGTNADVCYDVRLIFTAQLYNRRGQTQSTGSGSAA